MVKVMKAVKYSKMGVNRAAKEYAVPMTTLKDRLSGKVQHGRKSGPKPYLSLDKEEEPVTILIDVCKMDQGRTKREVIDIVRSKVNLEKKKEGKNNDHFNGEGWWAGFKQRHPNLSLRTSDALSYCRSNAVDQEISNIFHVNLGRSQFYFLGIFPS